VIWLSLNDQLDSRLAIFKIVFTLAFLTSDNFPVNRFVLKLGLVKSSKLIQVMHSLALLDGLLRAKIDKHTVIICSNQLFESLTTDHLKMGNLNDIINDIFIYKDITFFRDDILIFNDIENVLGCVFRVLAVHVTFNGLELSTADNDSHG